MEALSHKRINVDSRSDEEEEDSEGLSVSEDFLPTKESDEEEGPRGKKAKTTGARAKTNKRTGKEAPKAAKAKAKAKRMVSKRKHGESSEEEVIKVRVKRRTATRKDDSEEEDKVIIKDRISKNQPKLERQLRAAMASAAAAASVADDDINFSETDVQKAVYMQLAKTVSTGFYRWLLR
jgi:hypothetical protein